MVQFGSELIDRIFLIYFLLFRVFVALSGMNRFVSVLPHPELPLPVATVIQPPPVTEKKTPWFRKSRSKDDKQKIQKSESLSKETEAPAENHVAPNTPSDGGVSDSRMSLTDKDKTQEQIKKLGIDFFSEDFEGTTMSSTRCLSCETVTEQKETMIDLSVPITANMENIESENLIQVNWLGLEP